MVCLGADALGVWRGGGNGENPVTVVNGRLLTLTPKGDLLIAAADPTGYHELARITIDSRKERQEGTETSSESRITA